MSTDQKSKWILINDANKNINRTYITKTIIKTDITDKENILPYLDESYFLDYTTPSDAYNIIAIDLNNLTNFKTYKLMVPEKNINNIIFTTYDYTETTVITSIYRIYNPDYNKLREFHTLIRNEYLHKYFV